MNEEMVARLNEAWDHIRRRHRLGAKPSYEKVAKLLGKIENVEIGGTAIAKWLSGDTTPTYSNLFHFARLAGLNPGYVAWGHPGTEGEIPIKPEDVQRFYPPQPRRGS